jgi:hypothetical protein
MFGFLREDVHGSCAAEGCFRTPTVLLAKDSASQVDLQIDTRQITLILSLVLPSTNPILN